MPGFDALLVARALAGAMAASVIPLSMAWIGDVVSYEHRQPVLAKFLIGQILGLSAGAVIGGLSAEYFGWRFPFFLIAAWFAATSVGLHSINRLLPAGARALHVIDESGFRRMFVEFRHVLRLAWAQQVLLTVSLEGAVIFGALAFVPAHLHSVYGLSLASSGSLVMLFGCGGLIFALRSRDLVSRLGEVGLINAGAMLVGASLLLLALTPFWWLAFPACAGFGLGFYMLHNTRHSRGACSMRCAGRVHRPEVWPRKTAQRHERDSVGGLVALCSSSAGCEIPQFSCQVGLGEFEITRHLLK